MGSTQPVGKDGVEFEAKWALEPAALSPAQAAAMVELAAELPADRASPTPADGSVIGSWDGAPRSVLRGAKCEGVVIDWMRWSGPRERVGDVEGVLDARFGPAMQGKTGRFRLQASKRWAGGAGVFYDYVGKYAAAHCVVDLPGSFLAPVPGADRVQLMRVLLAMGFKPTRLDLGIDWRGVGIELIGAMRTACEGGELCGARRWQPYREFSGRRVLGDGLGIGKRGKDGSGRYVRGYDKGLETGEEPEGRWVRLELELSDDCAAQAAAIICGVGQWEAAAVELVLGAVDFREVTGDKHLAKRPRAGWWAAVLGGMTGARVVASRSASKLGSCVQWLKVGVFAPLRAHAESVGMSLVELVRFLGVDQVPASRSAGLSAVGHQLRELVNECRDAGRALPATVAELMPGGPAAKRLLT